MTAQPGVKLGVLTPGGRDHGHEATAMGRDMGQILVGTKLAIGHIEEVGHAAQFKRQLAAGVPMAVGSDVGPFQHGTQARELELIVQYGMKPAAVLQADMLNGAKLLGWDGQIGELKSGYYADVIAVPGNPVEDISVLRNVAFVMKGGVVYKQ